MKIVTWNVNSLKVRLPHVLDWLDTNRPDALCLQELKLEDKAFPVAELEAAGYRSVFNGQKTYNGVAILSPHPMDEVTRDIPGFDDEQKRIIAATIGDTRIICGYFPNGQAVGSEKFAYKMRWLAALTEWIREEMKRYGKLVLTGDFNVAPEARDAHPDWKDEIHVSEPEREAFRALVGLGLEDVFRRFDQDDASYSWWDYRMGAFRRNFGLRIDHVLASKDLATLCSACAIDKSPRRLERPSDHAPVVAEFDLPPSRISL